MIDWLINNLHVSDTVMFLSVQRTKEDLGVLVLLDPVKRDGSCSWILTRLLQIGCMRLNCLFGVTATQVTVSLDFWGVTRLDNEAEVWKSNLGIYLKPDEVSGKGIASSTCALILKFTHYTFSPVNGFCNIQTAFISSKHKLCMFSVVPH